MIFRAIASRLIRRAQQRDPDFSLGTPVRPYLKRWWLIPRNRVFNIYLHLFLDGDPDKEHHDHPWFNLSVLLRGQYIEETIRAGGVHVRKLRAAGAIKLRSPWAAHRVELVNDMPCWSLFLTGPVMRIWGFHCPKGWVDFETFTGAANGAAKPARRGCD